MNADALYQSLGRLIAAIGEPDFGAAAFALVEQAIQADHIVANLVGKNQIRGCLRWENCRRVSPIRSISVIWNAIICSIKVC